MNWHWEPFVLPADVMTAVNIIPPLHTRLHINTSLMRKTSGLNVGRG